MTYQALKSLGIDRPHEISSYTLTSLNDVDILRIKYTRRHGSLLPTSKKFKFPRRPMPGVCPSSDMSMMMEISPALEEAVEELSHLLSEEITLADKKKELLVELEEFHEYINAKMQDFKTEIENI